MNKLVKITHAISDTVSMNRWFSVGKELLEKFSKHEILTLSAALAFYTALSLSPLLLITLSVVGVLGEHSQTRLLEEIRNVLGDQASTAITTVIHSAHTRPSLGNLARTLGILFLVFSASSVFVQLQYSLNKIWEIEGKISAGLWSLIRHRLLSMGMVISLGFLALVSLLVSTVLSFFLTGEGQIWQFMNFLVTLLVFSALFALIFKFVPDTKISWRNAFSGGIVTAILFALGKNMIGIYLGRSAVGSAYGAAGSLIVFLTWVYYSSVIVFTGAEITCILTTRHTGVKRPAS
ncbi:YihY/virulence factor BrkB family protein [Sulfuriferula sp. AH1]|uniref:YihY/virulence factor BrkB family protein n=1 Tax=Sulfuriferula sp. AH1 TaxID=1985873 RepID=UPI0012F93E93|nr:YihY/virulence factor BrkB family protein [Sulfuriferula sp. AH1]